jgi:hypothetical protein
MAAAWTRALDLHADDATAELLDAFDVVFAVGEDLPAWAVDWSLRFVFVRGDAWCGRCVAALVDRAHNDPMQLFDLVRDRGPRTLAQAEFAVARYPQLLRPHGRFECACPPGADLEVWVPALVAAAHPAARPLIRVAGRVLTVDRARADGAWVDDLGFAVASPWMSQRPVGHWLAQSVEAGHWLAVLGCPPDAYPALCLALDAGPGVGVWADCAEHPAADRARAQMAEGARLEFGGQPPPDVAVVLLWDAPDASLDVSGDCAILVHGTAGAGQRRVFDSLRAAGVPCAELRVREGLGFATRDARLFERLTGVFKFEFLPA